MKKFFLSISFFLFYSMELDHLTTIQYFNNHIWQLPRPLISTERLQLFHLLNGDIFYPIRTWPPDIKQLFWKKPTGDNDTFKLLLFFIGNGCSPQIIAKWILTSQHWSTHDKGIKRSRQIDFIFRNMTTKSHIWFYFDIHHNQWLYLNGERRNSTDP